MKRVILSVLCSFAVMVACAQMDTGHLAFNGIPLDGSLSSFIQKMEQKKFSLLLNMDSVAVMRGDFASVKNCSVTIASGEEDLVYMAIVTLPQSNTWRALYDRYVYVRNMLTEKYGEPVKCYEEFQGIQPDDDVTRMRLVKTGQCEYSSSYNVGENGVVCTGIGYHGNIGSTVIITYVDLKNALHCSSFVPRFLL